MSEVKAISGATGGINRNIVECKDGIRVKKWQHNNVLIET